MTEGKNNRHNPIVNHEYQIESSSIYAVNYKKMKNLLVASFLMASSLWGQVSVEFRPVESIRILQNQDRLVIQIPPKAHLKTTFLKVEALSSPQAIRMGELPKASGKDELGDNIYRQELIWPILFNTTETDLELTVTYQPCTEGPGGICYPPTQQKIKVRSVASSSTDISFPWWSFLGIFFAGLLASLTPCVYPMIPITIAVIGIRDISKKRAAILTLALVMGMAIMYSLLGIFAVLSGNVFGSILGSASFIIVISILFFIFGLSLLGAFEFSISTSAQNRLQSWSTRSGIWAPFLTGVVLGPLSAPCIGPILGTILVSISKGSLFLGAVELFIFALGMGVPFMLVGILGVQLPKSGAWLEFLKKTMGFIVLAFAIWTLRTILPVTWTLWLCFALVIVAIWLYQKIHIDSSPLKLIYRIICVLLGLFVVYFSLRLTEVYLKITIFKGSTARILGLDQSFKQEWMNQDLEAAIEEAKKKDRPILVDVYADWCAACFELDQRTWPDEAVRDYVRKNYIAIRIDMDKIRPDLAKRYQILGYPTILVLDTEGREIKRILGYQSPQEMLRFMNLNQVK